MTMTPIWNVRGVRLETRQKAKAAAAWTGMTIGEWVDRAVGVMAEDDLHTKLPKMRIAPEYPCGLEEVAAAEKIGEGEVESNREVNARQDAIVEAMEGGEALDPGLPEFLQERGELGHTMEFDAVNMPAEKGSEKSKVGRPAKAKGEKKKAAKCAHGVGKGINCWQCGGLAKIEA